jgi:hypothetical protein
MMSFKRAAGSPEDETANEIRRSDAMNRRFGLESLKDGGLGGGANPRPGKKSKGKKGAGPSAAKKGKAVK